MAEQAIVNFDFKLSAETPFLFDYQTYDEPAAFPVFDMHAAIHLITVLSGTFRVSIGGAGFVFGKGEVFLVGPWEIHGNYSVDEKTSLLSLIIDPEQLGHVLQPISDRLATLYCLPPEKRTALLNRSGAGKIVHRYAKQIVAGRNKAVNLHWIAVTSGNNSVLEKLGHWLEIQQLFISMFWKIGTIDFPREKLKIHELIRPALKLLAGNESRPLSTESAARECRLSRGYFNLCFQKLYNVSFYVYELNYRLKRASEDLASGRYTVKETASLWGFADTAHFSRTFKKHFSLSPSEYMAAVPPLCDKAGKSL